MHMCVHTHTHAHKRARTLECVHSWAPKTASMGNGEFPKPQSAQEGEGSCVLCTATKWAKRLTGTVESKEGRGRQRTGAESSTKMGIGGAWQFKGSMSEIHPHNCGQIGWPAGCCCSGRRAVVVLAASLTQFGKSQISHQSQCPTLRGLGMPASDGGPVTAEVERLNFSSSRRLPGLQIVGTKVIWNLVINGLRKENQGMSLQCRVFGNFWDNWLSVLTFVGKLQRLQFTSRASICGHRRMLCENVCSLIPPFFVSRPWWALTYETHQEHNIYNKCLTNF